MGILKDLVADWAVDWTKHTDYKVVYTAKVAGVDVVVWRDESGLWRFGAAMMDGTVKAKGAQARGYLARRAAVAWARAEARKVDRDMARWETDGTRYPV